MAMPIDLIPNTFPPKFKWKREVDGPNGKVMIDCEGMMPSSVELAVLQLVKIAKQQRDDIVELRRINSGMADRIAAQSELLSQQAEKKTDDTQVVQTKPTQSKKK